MDLQAVLDVEFDHTNISALKKALNKRWNKTVDRITPGLSNRLPKLMVDGGGNFKAFVNTKLFRFLNTPEALAELGFVTIQPLYEDLLPSLRDTIKVVNNKKKLRVIQIDMIDMQMVSRATIHRSAGTGQLGQISWFVDWIISGLPVQDYSFERTGPPIPRSSRIAGAEAGLMVPSRGGGFWQFPPIYKYAIMEWLQSNIPAITRLVEVEMKIGIA